MPGGDRTGPMGMGAMTGRAAGYCAGFGAPGYAGPRFGRGYHPGFGRGFRGHGGWGRALRYGFGPWGALPPYDHPMVYANPDPEAEKRMLKEQSTALQSELDAVKKRLGELEGEGEET